MALHCSRTCRKYLLHLAQENVEFRLPEIKALLSLSGVQFTPDEHFDEKSPFWVLSNVSEEDVRNVMKRTVCAKSVFELWGHGRTHQELQLSLKNYPTENMVPYLKSDSTYKINVYTFNKTVLHQERIQKIDTLEFLPFSGKVNLKNPDHVFCLLENYGSDPNRIPEDPFYVYFGRWIADGQRDLIRSFSVKKRHFIGNTSMDAGLSFIMANHGKVKANDLVFDPFVGTGSLLVACAHFGSYVCGTDIDYNTIHGIGKASRKNQKWRGPDENIRANLRQYGAEKSYVDVLVSDASKNVWRTGSLFDAIITDPPYGIRESTRKTGSQKEMIKPPEDFNGESHVPVSMAYHLSDIFTDLLNFAAKHLVINGRLVYWLPVYRPEYKEEIIPQHPCLKLISNCEQTLSSHTSRRLVTMEKLKEFEDADGLAHLLHARFNPYQGHNSFREKYFSGLKKKTGKDEFKNTKKL
ncbi:tRNA (guanine(10)-N2)-methyltransferase homolog isoform X1 [Lepisosteus oculatus]|uniref:tRNA (guanine(10)-N(2))-methyltransferase TRMT11 n=1 Tax=Lepisosteus oculatus TaxID=7918 RepID=W5NIE5_LEPOC|nr:PREDICTED: tRNA (guanine(10)-N2)-methyltransferase homolog isoform X1 [Lepisosteus oculatus]